MIDYYYRLRDLVSDLQTDITHLYHQFSESTQQRLSALQAVQRALPNFKTFIEDMPDTFLEIQNLRINRKVCQVYYSLYNIFTLGSEHAILQKAHIFLVADDMMSCHIEISLDVIAKFLESLEYESKDEYCIKLKARNILIKDIHSTIWYIQILQCTLVSS